MIDSVFRKSQSETPPASNKYVFSISQRKCVSILFYALVSAKIPLFLCFLLTMENTSYDCLIVYSDRDITQSLWFSQYLKTQRRKYVLKKHREHRTANNKMAQSFQCQCSRQGGTQYTVWWIFRDRIEASLRRFLRVFHVRFLVLDAKFEKFIKFYTKAIVLSFSECLEQEWAAGTKIIQIIFFLEKK